MTDQDQAAILPAQPGYRTVLRVRWLIAAVPVVGFAIAVDVLLLRDGGLPWGFLSVASVLLALLLGTIMPTRQHRRLGYVMGADSLRVLRGMMFHSDTIVPFVRVQHIDIGQGPIERLAKVAHVVVHTAGTHNSTVTLPGLAYADAIVMRDTIRGHIQTDFA